MMQLLKDLVKGTSRIAMQQQLAILPQRHRQAGHAVFMGRAQACPILARPAGFSQGLGDMGYVLECQGHHAITFRPVPTWLAASTRGSPTKWAYRWVVWMVLCPNNLER